MSSFKKGGMYILSSPSGAGKTTLVKKISKNRNFLISISHTTRRPRPNEINGKDYYFTSKNKFLKLIKEKKFLEYAKVFDNFYGSSKKLIISKLDKGKNVIFDIDWQGTRKIKKKKLDYSLLTIFILPPSRKELINRLIKREKKNIVTVNKRMKEFKKDLLRWKDYDYVVINDDLDKCFSKIKNLINAEINNGSKDYDLDHVRNHIEKLTS